MTWCLNFVRSICQNVCFLTWGMLLLTHSALGRISSHMIILRARVCEHKERLDIRQTEHRKVVKVRRGKCVRAHTLRGTLTLNSKNSGLIKSSRNQVSGGFSQSAIALVNKTRKKREGVNIHLCQTLNQCTDSIIWELKERGTSWPTPVNYNKVTEKWSFDYILVRQDSHNA